MRSWLSLIIVAILAVPVFAFGPMGGGMMGQQMPDNMWGSAEFKPVVGHWAEYLMTSEDEEPVTIRISIVGEEDGAYWYEMQMMSDEEEGFITKMLVSGDPQDEDNLKRLIIKGGDEPAMEMPVGGMMGGMMGGRGQQSEMTEVETEMPDVKPVDLGMETVTVPAGTFEAHHWRVESDEHAFDMWQATKVGPYGIVKSSSEDFEMVLTGHGEDATSAITEEPEKFEMPSFNMQDLGG